MTNSVFRHKIVTHGLLSYAMQHATGHLSTITSDELWHGDMMAPSSLMPAAAADIIAQTFFDFVLKHNLTDTMVSMSAHQIQDIAIFLSHIRKNKHIQSVFISASFLCVVVIHSYMHTYTHMGIHAYKHAYMLTYVHTRIDVLTYLHTYTHK